MNIETDITIGVYTDADYHYEVHAGDTIYIKYTEHINEHNINKERTFDISFGSLDEMEAVAKAMLKVVATSR